MNTVIFSNDSRTVHDRIDIKKIGKLTDAEYTTGGCTALYDAVGSTIGHIDQIHKYIREEDVPAHTVFIITTDGMENASRMFDRESVCSLIKTKQDEGWEFIFMAANIDAEKAASDIGIRRERAVNYHRDRRGTKLVFEAMDNVVTNMRRADIHCAQMVNDDWKAELNKDFNSRKSER